LRLGKYVTNNLNIGIRTGLGITNGGNSYTIGPYFKYDFYEAGNVYFSATGSFHYTRYNNSYWWNDFFNENDAQRIVGSLAPSVAYRVNNNVEIYWQFASMLYYYDWLTLKETSVNCWASGFRIRGPFSNNTFGLIFRF
jgi:hypothetical protein